MKHHQLQVTRTAHFYTLGEINPETKRVWIVIHGYGMLANYFIKKFEPLQYDSSLIVAPDGLSYYYLDEQHSRVGASWMTKNHRESEIHDHIAYLNQLYTHIVEQTAANTEVNVLGFSQGVSTVVRWVAAGQVKVNRLVLWSGRLPEDGIQDGMRGIEAHYVYGLQDEYRQWLDEEKQRVLLKRYYGDYHWDTFDGGHRIPLDVLAKLAKRYKW
jgi:predicted esterase